MIEELLQETGARMEGPVKALSDSLRVLRTGRASPALVERLEVEYYGTSTPLNQLASISVPEAHLLVIRPWDPEALSAIERAILASDLGLTPNNDGHIIRLPIRRPTEERRGELVRMVRSRVEEARVAVRNIRREALNDLRDFEREGLISEDDFYRARDDLQELTDSFTDRIDELGEAKEEEISEV
ncbi:MAG: ribosome recycling factor [Chloroflexota bacterium]|nr:ribosome recycling factor [Chloroflexota bacterium]